MEWISEVMLEARIQDRKFNRIFEEGMGTSCTISKECRHEIDSIQVTCMPVILDNVFIPCSLVITTERKGRYGSIVESILSYYVDG